MDCPVCLKKVEDYIKTKCNHFFCKICLDKWLDIKNTCPMCREKLKEKIELPKRTYREALLGVRMNIRRRLDNGDMDMANSEGIDFEILVETLMRVIFRQTKAVDNHYIRMCKGRNKVKFIKI